MRLRFSYLGTTEIQTAAGRTVEAARQTKGRRVVGMTLVCRGVSPGDFREIELERRADESAAEFYKRAAKVAQGAQA